MSKLLKFVLPFLVVAACSKGEEVAPVAPHTAPVVNAKAPDDAFFGVVTSSDTQLVTSEVDGAVRELKVHPGDSVIAGATIAILDDSMIAKQIEEARGQEDASRGQVLQAQSQYAEASRQYAQLRGLLSSGSVPRDSVKSAAAAASVAAASVKIAQGALARSVAGREQLEQLRSHATIVAPIDGVVSLVKVSQGQMAGRGMPIARVSNPAGLKLRFAVPREARDKMSAGVVLTVTIKGVDKPMTAKVKTVGQTLEPPLQFAVVEAELDELPADHASLLGALAEVRIAAI